MVEIDYETYFNKGDYCVIPGYGTKYCQERYCRQCQRYLRWKDPATYGTPEPVRPPLPGQAPGPYHRYLEQKAALATVLCSLAMLGDIKERAVVKKMHRLATIEKEEPMKILTMPNAILRAKSKPIETIDSAVKNLAGFMLGVMNRPRGDGQLAAGLAAPQLGQLLRLIVFRYDTETVRVLVNPRIVKSKGSCIEGERCLSVPGMQCMIERPQIVKVKGLDIEGNPVTIKAHGTTARILCHEIDHLDGILITDKEIPAEMMKYPRSR